MTLVLPAPHASRAFKKNADIMNAFQLASEMDEDNHSDATAS